MYDEKKVIIYVIVEKLVILEDVERTNRSIDAGIDFEGNENWLDDIEVEDEMVKNYEDDSDYCHSEESYRSLDSDSDYEIDIEYEGEFYSYDQNDPKMDVGVQYSHVVAFRRALSHYTVINDFELKTWVRLSHHDLQQLVRVEIVIGGFMLQ
jgi:hypothetical protein